MSRCAFAYKVAGQCSGDAVEGSEYCRHHQRSWTRPPLQDTQRDTVEVPSETTEYAHKKVASSVILDRGDMHGNPDAMIPTLGELDRAFSEDTAQSQAASMLKDSAAAVEDRHSTYGSPDSNFRRIAERWRLHLEHRYGVTVEFDPADVSVMMADVKLARLAETPDHADSWTDVAGYAACGYEVTR